jgi:hypothetical protein
MGGGGSARAVGIPSPRPLPQGEGEDRDHAPTDAEIRALLIDCLSLWGVPGRVAAQDDGLAITADDGIYLLQRAAADLHPVRWFLQTPSRRASSRPPRAAPSIVALLGALRNALGAEGGNRLRIGMGAPPT